MQVTVCVPCVFAACTDADSLPFCQLSALLCALQIAFNDHKLTGDLWVQHSSESQQRKNQNTVVYV